MTLDNAEIFYRRRVEALVAERRRLEAQGAPSSRLEQNRVALARARWQLARVAGESPCCDLQIVRAASRGGSTGARKGVAEPPPLRDAAPPSPPADASTDPRKEPQ